MRRFLRVILPLAIVAVIVVIVVAVVTARPALDDDEKAVGTAWGPLATELDARYGDLAQVNDRLRDLTGPVHDLAEETHDELAAWRDSADKSVAARAAIANRIEELRRRLFTTAQASERVRQDDALAAAVATIADQPEPGSAGAYNTAVDAYAKAREGPVIGVLAPVLGYGAIPRFAVVAVVAPAPTTAPAAP